jgi:hypothetical protein
MTLPPHKLARPPYSYNILWEIKNYGAGVASTGKKQILWKSLTALQFETGATHMYWQKHKQYD